jgi:uncharacterized membrane protein
MLKKISIILVLILALPFIAALFVDSNYHVEREVMINKDKESVFNYLKYLENQSKFSKWAQVDPAMKKSSHGIDGTVGFYTTWESENPNVGKGEQEIIAIKDGQRIDYQLRFLAPFKSTEPAYIITEELTNNKTLVKWGFTGHMNYPMNLMLVIYDFEKTIGDDLQQGLDNLKKLLETNVKD